METKPPVPPFTEDSGRQKVRMAEDAWNTRDPDRVVLVYAPDTRWRNRAEFPVTAPEARPASPCAICSRSPGQHAQEPLARQAERPSATTSAGEHAITAAADTPTLRAMRAWADDVGAADDRRFRMDSDRTRAYRRPAAKRVAK
jgi:ketosteroid isomerase-like protein